MTERLTPSMIFIICFLSTFFILIGLIPSGFVYSQKTYMQYEYPSYFDKSDIENIKFFENGSLSRGLTSLKLDFNPDVNFAFRIYWFTIGNNIQFKHITWVWLIFETSHTMSIETDSNFELTKSEAVENWDSDFNATILYPVKCNHITIKVWITDNNSTRNDIAEAWDEGTVNIGMGFGFDDVGTTMSAWDLIGRLLILQAVEIGPWYLQLMINIPIFAMIAYLTYRLILLAIPFVG